MADGIVRFISPDEMARARMRYLTDFVAPVVQSEVFDQLQDIQSATLCISQFFNDEATDEVHQRWELSAEQGMHAFTGYQTGRHSPGRDFCYGPTMRSLWSGQLWSISMFASFSPEGVYDPSDIESWGTCASFNRGASAPEVNVSANPVRPWLNGVAPAYLRDDTPHSLKTEFFQWLDWLDPTVNRWPADLEEVKKGLIQAFDQFRKVASHDVLDPIDRELAMVDLKGPQPYRSFDIYQWRQWAVQTQQQKEAFAHLESTYQAALDAFPPPRAAFRS